MNRIEARLRLANTYHETGTIRDGRSHTLMVPLLGHDSRSPCEGQNPMQSLEEKERAEISDLGTLSAERTLHDAVVTSDRLGAMVQLDGLPQIRSGHILPGQIPIGGLKQLHGTGGIVDALAALVAHEHVVVDARLLRVGGHLLPVWVMA